METAELIEPWLWSTLTGDATFTAACPHVYGALTPDDPGPLYCTIAATSPRDIRGVGRARIQVEVIYLVKIIGQTTSQDDLLPAASRMSALLDGADRDVPGGHITCVREQIVSYPEVSGGQPFLHLGGQFRIWASTTT